MSLSYRQRQRLRRIGARLRRSDPELGAKFTMFGRLYEDQDMPATERVPRPPPDPGRAGFRRAAAWIGMPRARSGHQGRLGSPGWEAGIDQTDG